MLALTGEARRWEPRRLRLRLFSAAAQLVTTGRRRHLRFAAPLALDRRHHRRASTGSKPCRTPADQPDPRPYEQHHPPGAVEPGAHPTRQPGHQPAHHQPEQPETVRRQVDGPSRKIEARPPDDASDGCFQAKKTMAPSGLSS